MHMDARSGCLTSFVRWGIKDEIWTVADEESEFEVKFGKLRGQGSEKNKCKNASECKKQESNRPKSKNLKITSNFSSRRIRLAESESEIKKFEIRHTDVKI